MALFNGYVWELTLIYTYNDTVAYNVWHYGNGSNVGNADSVANSFASDVFPTIQSITSEDVTFTAINVHGVRGAIDFDDNPITGAGLIADPVEPNFVAFGYRFNRQFVGERHGYKRIGGVPDNAWVDGEIPPTVLTALVAAAPIIGGNINDGTYTYEPLIQRKQFDNNPVVPAEYFTFANCTFVNITTQSSRKR